ncbi:3-methyl-2-oxobutanoate hydroxymethyltransferase, partial [Streptomyces lydicus]
MHSRSGSPVAAGPEQVFSDLREVAARVRDGLSWEIPESLEELPADELPAGQIAQFAQQERTRVLSIPVMAHVGLTPQSVNAFGGYPVQGR